MLVPDIIHPEQTIQKYRAMDMLDLYIQTTSEREMSILA